MKLNGSRRRVHRKAEFTATVEEFNPMISTAQGFKSKPHDALEHAILSCG